MSFMAGDHDKRNVESERDLYKGSSQKLLEEKKMLVEALERISRCGCVGGQCMNSSVVAIDMRKIARNALKELREKEDE